MSPNLLMTLEAIGEKPDATKRDALTTCCLTRSHLVRRSVHPYRLSCALCDLLTG